jgi:predicted SprT family Zn-dependent metalloprotease
MNITVVNQLAADLMAEHGLHNWNFRYDRAKRRSGCCKHRTQTITLSVYYVVRNQESDIKNTILHEIAHALAGAGAGHGPKWRAICVRIGARPERCHRDHVVMPKGRYVGACRCRTYHRHRRPRPGAKYQCRFCHVWFCFTEQGRQTA